MTDPMLTIAIMGFWRQGFNTLAIGRFLQYPEHQVERWLHAEMERRRNPSRGKNRMKWGHHIPKEKRSAMAMRALSISLAERNMSIALAVIEDEFDVSNPTARNLVSYGKYLSEMERRRGETEKTLETEAGPSTLHDGAA